MALCDRLEAEKASRDHKRAALHAAAMNRLLGAPDAQAFAASWNFIAQNFGALYSTAENVADLKKAGPSARGHGKARSSKSERPARERNY
jgi:type I restriction enzyme S subunit